MAGIEPQQAEYTRGFHPRSIVSQQHAHVLRDALVGLEQNEILPLAISVRDVP